MGSKRPSTLYKGNSPCSVSGVCVSTLYRDSDITITASPALRVTWGSGLSSCTPDFRTILVDGDTTTSNRADRSGRRQVS